MSKSKIFKSIIFRQYVYEPTPFDAIQLAAEIE